MGKRLDQQPMYPQYTYYYPHYLQTKVGRRALRRAGAVGSPHCLPLASRVGGQQAEGGRKVAACARLY